jgi:hypothetical protein
MKQNFPGEVELSVILGRWIQLHRQKEGLTLEMVCDRLQQVDIETLKQYEEGSLSIPASTFYGLIILYQINLNEVSDFLDRLAARID